MFRNVRYEFIRWMFHVLLDVVPKGLDRGFRLLWREALHHPLEVTFLLPVPQHGHGEDHGAKAENE